MANHSIPADQRRKPRSLSLSDMEHDRAQAAARREGKKWVKFMRDSLATACERAEAAPAVEAAK
jgi:hypothetical protein